MLFLTLLLNSCFLKQDRTTTVYGTITDEKGQSVDSILVIFQGMKDLNLEILSSEFSDQKGEYDIVMEVPKKFTSINVTIPFFPAENSKYMRLFKTKRSTKNGQSTGNCCIAQIGEKTRYDFELIAK
ncbi:hypothetical protein [Dyadobacter crusticola]|uniref:hypothetical protein n=1 Tax=Dyadobacter crusticola TaxID=292407 RepID=UPI0012FA19B9|nr:hypothetical protein [Dyadobacter crusticola]